MTCICPTCGTKVDRPDPVKLGDAIAMPCHVGSAYKLLARNFGKRIPTPRLTEYLFRDDPEGGPENADVCARVAVSKLRKLVAPYDMEIVNDGGGRGAVGAYVLRWA